MNVGIDLGTTFSAIAYLDDNNFPQIIPNLDGARTTPSVVMFDGDDICVGEQAKLNSITDPYNVCQLIKRQMGDPKYKFETESGNNYSAEDISAMILKSLKTAAEQTLDTTITGAVITVPAYFNDAQRKATTDAGQIAGLNVLAVINEPTAAAIAYCHSGNKENQTVLVFDLGGGTFDVTIIQLEGNREIEILATSGHKNLGGFDFDNKIFNAVLAQFEETHGIDLYDDDIAMQELRGRAETAKKTLSTRNKTTIPITSQGKTLKMDITQEEFNGQIQGLLSDARAIMEIAMDDAELDWNQLDKIILVGGSTRIPAVQDMIKSVTGITPSHDVHPDEAVALGAACYAAALDPNNATNQAAPPIKVTDVNSHSLGVILNDTERGIQFNSILIPRNTKLPTEVENVICTIIDNQTSLCLPITVGEEEDLDFVTVIGEAVVDLKPAPAGEPVRLVINYDTNGIIHVSILDYETGENLGDTKIDRQSNLSDQEIKDKLNRMANLDVE